MKKFMPKNLTRVFDMHVKNDRLSQDATFVLLFKAIQNHIGLGIVENFNTALYYYSEAASKGNVTALAILVLIKPDLLTENENGEVIVDSVKYKRLASIPETHHTPHPVDDIDIHLQKYSSVFFRLSATLANKFNDYKIQTQPFNIASIKPKTLSNTFNLQKTSSRNPELKTLNNNISTEAVIKLQTKNIFNYSTNCGLYINNFNSMPSVQLRHLAGNGNDKAMVECALMHLVHDKSEYKYTKAMIFLNQAEKLQNVTAKLLLSSLYLNGFGVEKCPNKAKDYFREAVLSDPDGNSLIELLSNLPKPLAGLDNVIDANFCLLIYSYATIKFNIKAINELACMYEKDLIKKDNIKSFVLYCLNANLFSVNAITCMGSILSCDIADRFDPKIVLEFLRIAIDMEDKNGFEEFYDDELIQSIFKTNDPDYVDYLATFNYIYHAALSTKSLKNKPHANIPTLFQDFENLAINHPKEFDALVDSHPLDAWAKIQKLLNKEAAKCVYKRIQTYFIQIYKLLSMTSLLNFKNDFYKVELNLIILNFLTDKDFLKNIDNEDKQLNQESLNKTESSQYFSAQQFTLFANCNTMTRTSTNNGVNSTENIRNIDCSIINNDKISSQATAYSAASSSP